MGRRVLFQRRDGYARVAIAEIVFTARPSSRDRCEIIERDHIWNFAREKFFLKTMTVQSDRRAVYR